MLGTWLRTIPVIHKRMEQHRISVGTTEVSFPTSSRGLPDRVFIQAPSTNMAVIVVGLTGVKGDLSAGGFEYPVGANSYSPFDDINQMRAISPIAGQYLLVTYLFGV